MARNLWLARAALFISMLVAPPCWALDLAGLFRSGDDSGSGKVAKFEFRVRDGFAATSIAWSPDGKYIATSGTQTRLVHIWDIEQRKLVKELELPHPPAPLFHSMNWSPDGRYLATCNSFQSSLRIYDVRDWSVAKDFGRNEALACQKPIFSDDGQELTVWAGDLVTWDITEWKEKRRLKGAIDDGQYARQSENAWNSNISVRDIAYVGDSKTLVIGGGQYERRLIDACGAIPPEYTDRIWIIEPADKALTRSFVIYCSPTPGGTVSHLVAHPSGAQLALSVVGDGKRVVRVIDKTTGSPIVTLLEHEPKHVIQSISYTPDGHYLLVGQDVGIDTPSPIHIIDSKSFQVVDVVHALASIHDLTVEPRSARFAVSSFDGFAVWKFINH